MLYEIKKEVNSEFVTSKILNVQSLKSGTYQDAGYDMYLPKITTNFVKLLLERNKHISIYSIKDINGAEILANWKILNDFELSKLILVDSDIKTIFKFSKNVVTIKAPIAIPTGIQMILPDGYFAALDNRSSNFGKNFDVKLGYIDNSYTFGSAFQLTPIDFRKPIILDPETRIGQLVLHKLHKPKNEEITFHDFENLEIVKTKRELRSGGFGSTGTK